MCGLKSKNGSVLITGAYSGIGRACAEKLYENGFTVFAGMYDKKQQEEFEKELCIDDRMIPVIIDITNKDSIYSAYDIIKNKTGDDGLAGLVNNAGIALAGPIEYLPLDIIRRQLEVNIIGHFAVTQVFIKLLRKRQGRIVNIGSVSSRVSNIFLSPYAMSKHALKAFNDSLRMELKMWGMRVSLIEPGNVSTSIWDTAFKEIDKIEAQMPQEGKELYGEMIKTMRATINSQGSKRISPDIVASKVLHAITARKPKCYYPIGADRKMKVALNRWLPAPLYDKFVYNFLGLDKIDRKA